MDAMGITVRSISPGDEAEVRALLTEHWGTATIVSRGKKLDAASLPGFIAEDQNKRITGLVTIHIEQKTCEVVTLDAFISRKGIGRSLLEAAKKFAIEKSIKRLWLITTNDNLNALGFYQKLGMRIFAVHAGAVDASRKIKPEIPLVAENGIPIRDEIELEFLL